MSDFDSIWKVQCSRCGEQVKWYKAYILNEKYYCEHCTDVKCIESVLSECIV